MPSSLANISKNNTDMFVFSQNEVTLTLNIIYSTLVLL